MADMSQIEDILQRGIEFHRKNQFLEAEACYKEVLGIDPNNADAIHLLGLLADSIGDKDLAIDLIKIAISLQPDNAIYHSNLGNILKTHGQTEPAISSYLEALKHDPSHVSASFNLANLYRDLEMLDEAVPLYQQAVAISPDLAIAWINLAETLYKIGQTEEAISCYKNYLHLKPEDINGKTRLAEAYFDGASRLEDQGLIDEAMAGFEAALSVLPTHIRSRKKLGYLQAEKRRLLIKIDEDAIKLKHFQMGLDMHKHDQFQEAKSHYNRVIAMDRHNAKAQHLLRLASDAIADQETAGRLVADVVRISSADSGNGIKLADEEFQHDGYTFTQAMHDIWESRDDLQRIFDIHKTDRRFEYCKWLLMHGSIEHNLAPNFYPEDLLAKLVTVNGIVGKKALSMLLAKSRTTLNTYSRSTTFIG